MVIDIDSSPQSIPKEEPVDNSFAAIKHAAPFPDMGMPNSTGTSITIQEEHPSSHLIPMTEAPGSSKIKAEVKQSAPAAPVPMMAANLESNSSAYKGGRDVLDLTNSDLNFTDMEFTLAPGNVNPIQSGGNGAVAANSNGPPFDLSTLGSTNGATGTMSLTTSMSSSTVRKAAATASSTGPAPTGMDIHRNAEAQKKGEGTDAAFADIFAGDGQADGMDFDFSIGGGTGGDTFDDLMNDRDDTFDSMEHGDFDANFFGLNKVDEA